MLDFEIVTIQQCQSLRRHDVPVASRSTRSKSYIVTTGDETHTPTCTCPAYRYGIGGKNRFTGDNECKHIRAVMKALCGWHAQYGSPAQTEEQEKDKICPKCGGPTEYVRVAI